MARPPYAPALAAALAAALFAGCFAGLDEGSLTRGAAPGAGSDSGAGPGAGAGDGATPTQGCDDFSADGAGAAPAGWTFDGGDWSVVALGGAHALAQNDDHPSQRAYALYGASSWNDYTVTITLTPTQTNISDCIDGRWRDQDDHYSLCLRDGSSWTLSAYDRGSRSQLASGGLGYDAGSTHLLELAFRGHSITPRLDGDEKTTVSDDTIGSGGVGVSTSSRLTVSRVCVTP